MFATSIDREVVARIVQDVQVAIRSDKRTAAPVEKDYRNIEKTWLEYLRWCDDDDNDPLSVEFARLS